MSKTNKRNSLSRNSISRMSASRMSQASIATFYEDKEKRDVHYPYIYLLFRDENGNNVEKIINSDVSMVTFYNYLKVILPGGVFRVESTSSSEEPSKRSKSGLSNRSEKEKENSNPNAMSVISEEVFALDPKNNQKPPKNILALANLSNKTLYQIKLTHSDFDHQKRLVQMIKCKQLYHLVEISMVATEKAMPRRNRNQNSNGNGKDRNDRSDRASSKDSTNSDFSHLSATAKAEELRRIKKLEAKGLASFDTRSRASSRSPSPGNARRSVANSKRGKDLELTTIHEVVITPLFEASKEDLKILRVMTRNLESEMMAMSF